MYAFLKKRYGTWSMVSEVTGVPLSTIEKHIRNPQGYMTEGTLQKLRKVVELYAKE